MKKIINVCDMCKTNEAGCSVRGPVDLTTGDNTSLTTQLFIELCETCMQTIIQRFFESELIDSKFKNSLLKSIKNYNIKEL